MYCKGIWRAYFLKQRTRHLLRVRESAIADGVIQKGASIPSADLSKLCCMLGIAAGRMTLSLPYCASFVADNGDGVCRGVPGTALAWTREVVDVLFSCREAYAQNSSGAHGPYGICAPNS